MNYLMWKLYLVHVTIQHAPCKQGRISHERCEKATQSLISGLLSSFLLNLYSESELCLVRGLPSGFLKKEKKSPVYTLQLSQKSDFQPSTTKPDNIGHPTIKTGQIWPMGWFWRWFFIWWELKIFNFTLIFFKVIHFKSKNYEMGIKSFLKI